MNDRDRDDRDIIDDRERDIMIHTYRYIPIDDTYREMNASYACTYNNYRSYIYYISTIDMIDVVLFYNTIVYECE